MPVGLSFTPPDGVGPTAPELPGHWGWDGPVQSGRGDRDHRRIASRLLGESHCESCSDSSEPEHMSSSRNAGAGPAPHPLIQAGPDEQPATRHSLPRHLFASLNQLISRAPPPRDGGQTMDIIERLLQAVGHQSSEGIQIRISPDADGNIGLAVGDRSYNLGTQSSPQSPEAAVDVLTAEYIPQPTMHRWHDEMSVIPGPSTTLMTSRLANHIINRLLPDARKRADEAAKTAEEEAKKEAADAAKKAEQEAKDKEAKEAEEREAERKRVEEETALAAATALPESRASPMPALPADEVEMAEPVVAPESAAGPALARTIIQIRGEDVDITDTGIDLEFLQALPDDMRADVVEQHMREQNRHRQPTTTDNASAGEASAISAEFLDALPPEIRAEVVMQQSMEAARRSRPPATEPLRVGPPTGFLDALSADLRDVMMSGPGDPLGGIFGSTLRRPERNEAIQGAESSSSRAAREVVQLLERPGIAALVRLLFFPAAFKKNHLFRVLTNLCANSVTRAELLNLLLSVIQDGSGDLPMVDKSFQQMSLKGVTTTPKSSAKSRSADSAPTLNLFAHLQSDNIPTFIAQRCLEALSFIVSAYSPAVHYFLTEHEQAVGLKKPSSKKGKGKDKILPQTKFPIVILLGLLDRVNLLKVSGMMESLTALLATITRPLTTLKLPEAPKEDKPETTTGGTANVVTGPLASVASTEDAAPVVAPVSIPAGLSAGVVAGVPAGVSAGDTAAAQSSGVLSSPPNIPPAVLKLVVNCLTIGECSSRNFSQTLAVMQNLSIIPDAKTTILAELSSRCQSTGQEVMGELHDLIGVLGMQTDKTDPAALTAFSAPTSNQAQLLRLLKTIEYLHLNKVDSDPPGEEMTEEEKALGQVYQAFSFDALWSLLAECLTLVRDRDNTDQIALVLLPLVEALMVVCKYRTQPAREIRSPSLPPTSAAPVDVNNLFVSFTTAHRKALNVIVRNNPSLLGGSFSLLIRNPKVLEFENKRSWFTQKLRRKRNEMGHSGTLHLNVRRQYVFEDSYQALKQRSGDEVKYGKLSVKFYNEDGIDAGGVQREWFTVLAQQIFDPNFALFEPCAADQQTYQPNKHSGVHDLHLSYFKFVGRVIGKAVYDGRLLDAYFNRAFYKQILGRPVDMRDFESIDPE